jgi:hypothetical protein
MVTSPSKPEGHRKAVIAKGMRSGDESGKRRRHRKLWYRRAKVIRLRYSGLFLIVFIQKIVIHGHNIIIF